MSDPHTVDFLQKKYEVPTEREVRSRVSRTGRYLAGFFVVTALVGVFFSYRIAQITHGDEKDVGGLSFFSSFSSSLARLVTSGDKSLTGEESDRVNFLLLGVGGAGHDGAQLSDTMVFGSFKPSTNELGMLSIPRDLYVSVPGYGNSKINAANAYGEEAGTGKGLDLATAVVSEILDQPVHYTIRVDFDGFSSVINQLGGVDICVDRAFTDNQYPEYEGSPTYKIVTFEAGCQHLSGDEALEYARSRHGNNGEGTDFARAARQQKILLAVKDRALSLGVLLNPGKVTRILSTISNNIATNMSFWEMMKFAQYAPNIHTDAIALKVLDTAASGPLYSTTILPGPGYIVLPRHDDWSDLHVIAENIFTVGDAPAATPTVAVTPTTPSVSVEIQNGTSVSGLAYVTAQRLEGSNFDVVKIGNAQSKTVARTTIYDLTLGRKAAELSALKEFLGADVIMASEGWVYDNSVVPSDLTTTETPGNTLVTANETVDFLIIVGEDAASLALR
ncbi:MAG: LCP family protein [Patescibacteria group bacterium]